MTRYRSTENRACGQLFSSWYVTNEVLYIHAKKHKLLYEWQFHFSEHSRKTAFETFFNIRRLKNLLELKCDVSYLVDAAQG